MAKESEVNFRIAVGDPNGPRSAVWRGFSTKSEVYISHSGLGGIEKFSFHSSGICRRAFTEIEGPAEGESDRVLNRWNRISTPAADLIVYVLVVRFPTDYLSTALSPEAKTVLWIEPAPPGKATALDFVFSRAAKDAIDRMAQAAGERFSVTPCFQVEKHLLVRGRIKIGSEEKILRSPALSHRKRSTSFPLMTQTKLADQRVSRFTRNRMTNGLRW